MKNQGVRIALLVVIFIAIVVSGLYFALKPVMTKTKSYDLPSRTLPTVWVVDETAMTQVALRGYTDEVSDTLVSDCILPVGESRTLQCRLQMRDALTGIRYTVRTMEDHSLIQDDTADTTESDGNLVATLSLTNLLEKGETYYVDLVLSTEDQEAIHHYFKIYMEDDEDMAETMWAMTDFAVEFSEATFDKSQAQNLLPIYIQTDGSMGTSDYGYVNIHSPYKMLTWGTMSPTLVTGRSLKFSEIGESQVSLSLSYVVEIADGETTGRYDVVESYVIRYRNDRYYLLDYSRTMDREFDLTTAVAGNKVNYGIRSSFADLEAVGDDIAYDATTAGDIMAFSAEGNLYSYNMNTGLVTSVFAYETDVENYTTARLYGDNGHDIKILELDDSGDMDFLVYGYLEQGSHEGTNGIVFYHYDAADQTVEEAFYAASDLPYQILRSGVGTNAYVNESNVCYLVYGNSIYAIVLDGTESYQVTDQIITGQSAVSDDGSLIAWEQETGDGEGSTSISIMDTRTGNTILVSAEEALSTAELTDYEAADCRLKVLGFIDNDLVYGLYEAGAVYTEKGSDCYPMFCLNIVDGITGEKTGQYYYENVYVTQATVESTRIALTRVTERDGYQPLDDDYIILNTAMAETEQVEARVSLKTKSSEILLTEYYLQPATGTATAAIQTASTRYLKTETRTLETEGVDYDGDWLVYGHNRLLGLETSFGSAVNLAQQYYGVVKGRDGLTYFAVTPKATQNTIGLAVENDEDASSLANMMAMLLGGRLTAGECDARMDGGETMAEILRDNGNGTYLELYDCPVSVINYYLDQGNLVGCVLLADSGCLIYGYSSEGYSVYRLSTGEQVEMTTDEAAEYFSDNGNRFVTIMK